MRLSLPLPVVRFTHSAWPVAGSNRVRNPDVLGTLTGIPAISVGRAEETTPTANTMGPVAES